MSSRSSQRLARGEEGIAIIVAMLVLLVLGLFAAVVATGATSLNKSAIEDRDEKRAFAAAEAGLRYMSYRLSEQGATLCTTPLGNTPIPGIPGAPIGGPYCAPQGRDLGNGTRFEAAASVELGTLGSLLSDCAGIALSSQVIPIPGGGGSLTIPIRQHCIVSVGFAGDEVRRVQSRVSALTLSQLFRVGLTGRERTCISFGQAPCDALAGQGPGKSLVLSDIGSEKYINTGGSETCGILYTSTGNASGDACKRVFPPLGLTTLSEYKCLAPDCPPGKQTVDPQPLPEVVPIFRSYAESRCVTAGSDTARANCKAAIVPDGDTKTRNNNAALEAQIDAACGNGNYFNAGTRILNLNGCNGGKTVALTPGTYNLCGIIGNGPGGRLPSNLRFGAGASATAANPVVIMLDSPSRVTDRDSGTVSAESDCTTANNFIQGNNSALIAPTNAAAGALALQIYAYGTPACTTTSCAHKIELQNSGKLAAGFFAPDSQLIVQNSGTTGGGGGSGDCTGDTDATNDACEMTGAFYARWLDIGRGFEFTEDARFRTAVVPPLKLGFSRSAWRECSPEVPAGGQPLGTGC